MHQAPNDFLLKSVEFLNKKSQIYFQVLLLFSKCKIYLRVTIGKYREKIFTYKTKHDTINVGIFNHTSWPDIPAKISLLGKEVQRLMFTSKYNYN